MALIEVEGYAFTYVGASKPALHNIDFRIGEGEFVIIAGPTGCGKSTLLRSINGLIPHMHPGEVKGFVRVDGLGVADTPMSELAKKVGFLFQNPENQIFMFSVERDLAFGLENLGVPREEMRERVEWALKLLRIEGLRDRPPHELSDGQKQRVALAGVLALKPKILILDEPTSLLDPYTASELVKVVAELHKRLGLTVLVVEHRLELLASVASRVYVLQDGEVLLHGSPREVFLRDEVSALGVGVPTVVRLYRQLLGAGIKFHGTPLSPYEMAGRINVSLDD